MSTIYPTETSPTLSPGPQLHAFVIGVSDYPHLLGHAAGPALLAHDPLGLGQVSTPKPTAQAIVKWLQEGYQHDKCALGSIELLISDDGHAPPTLANFRTAFRRWRARCESNPDNVAFFYFCGHGLNRGQQFLLPQDFGDPAEDAWQNCINFDAMRLGMRSVKVQTQLYFIDACRDTPFGMLMPAHISGYSPVNNLSIHDRVRCSAAYFATAAGEQAYGAADGVSFFGQAVIDCLDGVASLNRNGRWEVDTYQLASALGQVMSHQQRCTSLPLNSYHEVGGMALINLPSKPKVSVVLDCVRGPTPLNVRLLKGDTQLCSIEGQRTPLFGVVEGGQWQVQVSSPAWAPSRNRLLSSVTLVPPVFEGPLP